MASSARKGALSSKSDAESALSGDDSLEAKEEELSLEEQEVLSLEHARDRGDVERQKRDDEEHGVQ